MPMSEAGKYLIEYQQLMSEWDWNKNNALGINPDSLTCGSHKAVWWLCKKGHSWSSIVSNRTRLNRGCPYCAGQKAVIGENDICTTHPSLAKEWNRLKNGNNYPEDYMQGSHKKVWWICSRGHEWLAEIKSRCSGVGCPYCANKRVLPGFNDLVTTHPEIATGWHPTKNGNLKPSGVTFGSGKCVWWLCKNNHEWRATIYSRTKGGGCPICSFRRRTSFPEQAIFYYVKKAFPDALNSCKEILEQKSMELDMYVPSMKVGIEYDGKQFHSQESNRVRDARKYLRCREKGVVLIRVTDNLKAEVLANCDYKIVIPTANDYNLSLAIWQLLDRLGKQIDVNVARDRSKILNFLTSTDLSLLDMFPELAKEWDYEKNEGLLPSMFHPGSNEKVWWKCASCGTEWKTSLAERTGRDKTGCPKCAKKIGAEKHHETILRQKGSIVETHPYLLDEWDYERNELRPENVSAGSGKKVWWKCKVCNYSWKTSVNHRATRKSGCPCCRNQVVIAGKNDLATTHPELLNEWDCEKNLVFPNEIVAGSSKKVWWICSKCGHKWCSVLNTRKNGVGCPACARDKKKKRSKV